MHAPAFCVAAPPAPRHLPSAPASRVQLSPNAVKTKYASCCSAAQALSCPMPPCTAKPAHLQHEPAGTRLPPPLSSGTSSTCLMSYTPDLVSAIILELIKAKQLPAKTEHTCNVSQWEPRATSPVQEHSRHPHIVSLMGSPTPRQSSSRVRRCTMISISPLPREAALWARSVSTASSVERLSCRQSSRGKVCRAAESTSWGHGQL